MAEQQALNEHSLQTIIMKMQLNPNLKLTLTDKCLRKVIVYLLNSNEMLSKIENYKVTIYRALCDYRSPWRNSVEMEVKNNISKLPLPEALKKEMMPIVKPVSYEILRWKLFHESFIHEDEKYFNKIILKQLKWTCEGAIDHRRTAQALLRLDVFDLEKRYRLACLYCLEEDIKLLWEQLPEKRKWYYHGGHDTLRVRELQLEFYWPYVLLGEESQLPAENSSFNKHALVCSGRNGNKTVSEYFFRKLTAEERDSALLSALDAAMYRDGREMVNWPEAHVQVRLGDVACYFLSLLSPEQQMRLLRENPCAILNLLYDWPWHEVFLEIMDVVWTFLPQDQYGTLMDALMHADHYFPNLFQKVFIGSPVLFRNYFVDSESRHSIRGHIFPDFFDDHDIETVRVIFENINHGDVISLLSSKFVVQLFDEWVMKDSLDMIELCFQVASLSETDRKTLRAVYVGFLDSRGDSRCALVLKEKWKTVFTFLDNVASCNKRISEDETSAEVKKLCTEEEKNDTEK
ncbi:uncharacterized protein LOC129956863 [Argiope bruennichi]|uniref:Uncharacterized protein n=1 Tax=Argiope bruennichi TaxID=94029 RepID=A0A8T0FIB2_ARGBR|nr:uncharacterized protein LOC129956863 [Argiope bruennichi]XP_055924793.1 uncharacterized protein LOC129956863 [Argiope bruennichi]XP_055924794.1 uncharacterized protein LOC129956863 [Argiope bruennichi]XP_055924795.1 uncharacterized protein LOC129956863 [Argiope bruennichi]KAF8789259.1 hypothetical protein HNY73_007207 [Argiope bruennichi]